MRVGSCSWSTCNTSTTLNRTPSLASLKPQNSRYTRVWIVRPASRCSNCDRRRKTPTRLRAAVQHQRSQSTCTAGCRACARAARLSTVPARHRFTLLTCVPFQPCPPQSECLVACHARHRAIQARTRTTTHGAGDCGCVAESDSTTHGFLTESLRGQLDPSPVPQGAHGVGLVLLHGGMAVEPGAACGHLERNGTARPSPVQTGLRPQERSQHPAIRTCDSTLPRAPKSGGKVGYRASCAHSGSDFPCRIPLCRVGV
eukprot:7391511-Prymnesium_polylepis.2